MLDDLHITHNPKTLIDLFQNVANDKRIHFIKATTDIRSLTYRELREESLHQLGFLQAKGIQKNDPLLIILPQPESFVPIFWASVFGGLLPVPIAINQNEAGAKKLFHLIQELDNPWIISDEKFIDALANRKGAFEALEIDSKKLINYQAEPSETKGEIAENITPEDIAYLQYSSGSTSKPKGIIVKHSNVLYNLDGILKRSQVTSKDTSFSWLPMSHDMGLLGTHLLPVAGSCDQHLMPPTLFVRHPIFWLQQVAKTKATFLFSPNFGFKYFLQNYDPNKHSIGDLSNVRLLFNGAEPIDVELSQRFVSEMVSSGLHKNAMYCGYGMAEASLVVSIPEPFSKLRYVNIDRDSIEVGKPFELIDDDHGSKFVGLGTQIPHQEIRVCDEHDQVLPDGHTGHIQIRGKNVTAGYYNNPEVTAKTILPDGWLKTGDIGAFSEVGLLILGREKEMIIINGQNYFPHDLEQLVEKHIPELLGNIVIASHVIDETEKLVVFVKQRKKSGRLELENKIKQTLSESCGVIASKVIYIKSIPKTTSGKIQRHILISEHISEKTNTSLSGNASNAEGIFRMALTHCFGKKEFDFDKSLMEQGCSSMQISQLADKLSELFKTSVTAVDLFDYNSPNAFISYISKESSKASIEKESVREKFQPIAVIGASCYFPGGVESLSEFHEFLMSSQDVVRSIPNDRWPKDIYYTPGNPQKGKMYTDQGYFMENPDLFDASFFGLSEDEAKSLDPQQRLLLKASWNAIEHAGITKKDISGTETGVYIGLSNIDYMQSHIRSGNTQKIDQFSLTSILHSTAAGRISYFFNLNGPALTTDTACSSSLVSLHLACNAIKNKECKQALAGGVNLMFTPEGNIALSQVKALAKDGRCKTFDERADGYGRSEGVGMVFLKSLEDAEKDGDTILGVIQGSALNQDGKSNGLTAPNSLAQQRLIESALESGNINPDDVYFVEAHGTGTPLGDPIELQALEKAYNKTRNPEKPLILGSVKSNIGHTESAAGIAGFLKILGAFQKNVLPQNLHFQNPNPLIPWDKLNITVANKAIPLQSQESSVFAGISSFGFSGTNAHVIVSSHPQVEKEKSTVEEKPHHTICLSAHRKDALQAEVNQLLTFIQKHEINPIDLCHTWNSRRSQFEYRVAFGFADLEDLKEQLNKFKEDAIVLKSQQKLAILFSGQGSQYSGMGKELFDHSPIFRMNILLCESILQDELPLKLTDLLFDPENKALLNQTQYTQVAICSLSYSLYQLLKSYSITAEVLCGHSIGEYVAACISGVMTVKEMLLIVRRRGKLMQSLPLNTGMISVMQKRSEAERIVRSEQIDLDVAVVNSDAQTVFAGVNDEIKKAAKAFDQRDVFNIPLRVSHAFHSKVMDPILDEFQQFIETASLKNGHIPVYRNKNGKPATNESLKDSKSWANHIRETVDFNACVDQMIQDGVTTFVELGPSSTLIGIAQGKSNFNGQTFSALKKGKSSFMAFQNLLGNLFTLGFDIDWKPEQKIYGGKLIELPNRIWIEKSYWIPPTLPDQQQTSSTNEVKPVEALFYLDTQENDRPAVKIDQEKPVLVIQNQLNTSTQVDVEQFEAISVIDFVKKQSIETNTQVCIPIDAVSGENPDAWFNQLSYHVPILNRLATFENNLTVFLVTSAKAASILPVTTLYRNLSKECDHVDIHVLNATSKTSVWKKTLPKKKRYISHRGVHIITGGFGAIGKKLCEFLLENKASHIYIPIRSKLTEDREQWVAKMNQQFDGTIKTISCDIGIEKDVQSFFESIKSRHKNIEAVYHLAGVLKDEYVGKLTQENLKATLLPKVYGAFWLHQFSKELHPNKFVLFSSASAYFANPGQTFYGTSNMCLHELALIRNQETLPVKLIAWGPWGEDGMAAELVESFQDLGIQPFNTSHGLQVLEQALSSEHNIVLALDVNTEKVSESFMSDSHALLENTNSKKQKKEQKSFNVAGLSSQEIKEQLLVEMNRIGKEILKLDEHTPLSNSKSYFEVGFNSLSLNQYRNRLNTFLGSEVVSVSILFKHTSILSLIDFIMERAFSESQEKTQKVPMKSVSTLDDSQLLKEIEAMSDEEIITLLNQYQL